MDQGPPKRLTQRHVPITVDVGEPLFPKPGEDLAEVTTELRARMTEQLDRVQRSYPESSEGAWWQPAHLGGTAPTPEEAAALDVAERVARRRS